MNKDKCKDGGTCGLGGYCDDCLTHEGVALDTIRNHTPIGLVAIELNSRCANAARRGDDVEMLRLANLSGGLDEALLEYNKPATT